MNQKKGIDYFETFTLVVQWMTVRLCLNMITLLGLDNKQINYTATFLQTPLDHDGYVKMPKIFTSLGKVWLLRQALYGRKYVCRAYCIHTKNNLEDLGFQQSDTDPCMFISPTATLLCYCDDCLLLYKSPATVDILTK